MFSCVAVFDLFYMIHIVILISDLGFPFSKTTGLLVVSLSISLNSLFGECGFIDGCLYGECLHKLRITGQMATDRKSQQLDLGKVRGVSA